MYKLFTDKPETFECDIKIEGASLSNSKARLVVETTDYSLLFNGKINSNGKCSIPIKKLKGLIDETSKGDIRLEVIAEDTYFTPWESKFEIEASKKVTVEVKSQTSDKQVIKETVQVKNIKNESIQKEPTNEIKVTQKETNHVVNIMKLLVREDISIENLSIKKDRLNKVIATYCKYKPITEEVKMDVIHGVLNELHKK
jgi:hypothetical protein